MDRREEPASDPWGEIDREPADGPPPWPTPAGVTGTAGEPGLRFAAERAQSLRTLFPGKPIAANPPGSLDQPTPDGSDRADSPAGPDADRPSLPRRVPGSGPHPGAPPTTPAVPANTGPVPAGAEPGRRTWLTRRRVVFAGTLALLALLGSVAGYLLAVRADQPSGPGSSSHGASDQAAGLPGVAGTPEPAGDQVTATPPADRSDAPATPRPTPSAGGTPPRSDAAANRPEPENVSGRPNPSGVNLALGKPATASGSEASHFGPSYAFDGDPTSRWGSAFSDNQWIRVDLGEVWSISRITLVWEHAYATRYRVEVSVDGRTWSAVYSTSSGTGGTVQVDDAATPARYVRMVGLARKSSYGYSLHEIEVR